MLWRAKGVYDVRGDRDRRGRQRTRRSERCSITVASAGASTVYDVAKGDDLTAKLPGRPRHDRRRHLQGRPRRSRSSSDSTFGHWAGAWAADPPDPSYDTVAPPAFTDFGAIAGMPDWGYNRRALEPGPPTRLRRVQPARLRALPGRRRRRGPRHGAHAGARHGRAPARVRADPAQRRDVRRGHRRPHAQRVPGPGGPDRDAGRHRRRTRLRRARARHGLHRRRDRSTARARAQRRRDRAGEGRPDALPTRPTPPRPCSTRPSTRSPRACATPRPRRRRFASEAWTFAGRSDLDPTAPIAEGAHAGAARCHGRLHRRHREP